MSNPSSARRVSIPPIDTHDPRAILSQLQHLIWDENGLDQCNHKQSEESDKSSLTYLAFECSQLFQLSESLTLFQLHEEWMKIYHATCGAHYSSTTPNHTLHFLRTCLTHATSSSSPQTRLMYRQHLLYMLLGMGGVESSTHDHISTSQIQRGMEIANQLMSLHGVVDTLMECLVHDVQQMRHQIDRIRHHLSEEERPRTTTQDSVIFSSLDLFPTLCQKMDDTYHTIACSLRCMISILGLLILYSKNDTKTCIIWANVYVIGQPLLVFLFSLLCDHNILCLTSTSTSATTAAVSSSSSSIPRRTTLPHQPLPTSLSITFPAYASFFPLKKIVLCIRWCLLTCVIPHTNPHTMSSYQHSLNPTYFHHTKTRDDDVNKMKQNILERIAPVMTSTTTSRPSATDTGTSDKHQHGCFTTFQSLPKAIEEAMEIASRHMEKSTSTSTSTSTSPSLLTMTDIYTMLVPYLHNFLTSLSRLLLICTASRTRIRPFLIDYRCELMCHMTSTLPLPTQLTDIETRRHREILLISISSILLYLHHQWKWSIPLHSQHLISLCQRVNLPLIITKILNQDIAASCCKNTDAMGMNIFNPTLYHLNAQQLISKLATMTPEFGISYRKSIAYCHLLRLLQKWIKRSPLHCHTLAKLQVHVILYRLLTLAMTTPQTPPMPNPRTLNLHDDTQQNTQQHDRMASKLSLRGYHDSLKSNTTSHHSNINLLINTYNTQLAPHSIMAYHTPIRYYALKCIKNILSYIPMNHAWRQSKAYITCVTNIYHYIRMDLMDDWMVVKNPDDETIKKHMDALRAKRNACQQFNLERYGVTPEPLLMGEPDLLELASSIRPTSDTTPPPLQHEPGDEYLYHPWLAASAPPPSTIQDVHTRIASLLESIETPTPIPILSERELYNAYKEYVENGDKWNEELIQQSNGIPRLHIDEVDDDEDPIPSQQRPSLLRLTSFHASDYDFLSSLATLTL